ncbi:MAG: glycosyl hydrolase [Bacteroidota bacterium]|nr:glycosyl hydrolase [Bacteroidota bacterium]
MRIKLFIVLALAILSLNAQKNGINNNLKENFLSPPVSAMPWVYWTWLGGNINKEGITADLEAMKRVGIGGVIILDVDQGTPHGPVVFFDSQWKSIFKHTIAEAKRLGMEVNMNNAQGYEGSGGYWITPDKAMQEVVKYEKHVSAGTNGMHWEGKLDKPTEALEYRDIAVLAIAEPDTALRSKFKLPQLNLKALLWGGWITYNNTGISKPPYDSILSEQICIPKEKIIDLTSKMDINGNIVWDVPAGEWTIIRYGHAWNKRTVYPTPEGEGGPESDKLSKEATQLHFNSFVKELNSIAQPFTKNTLVATHIDSWERGGQNWTASMRQEFLKRRGYDIVPYLPALSGRIIENVNITERFLFDLRKTVSELTVENYVKEYHRLAQENGLRLTYECYTTMGNDLNAANYVDEPMAEFWNPDKSNGFFPTTKSMSSVAHLNSRSIVSSEAFTSNQDEKWKYHPAIIKALGDKAFCSGVNRFVFHRYAAQPFVNAKPGLQMGPWGLHYERTNTWWEWSKPWHEYLARCQYLLRQGDFNADVLNVLPEEPLYRFKMLSIKGYDYDACGEELFKQVIVKDGKLVLPNGRQYKMLVLTHNGCMSVQMLTHIAELIKKGANVFGEAPRQTPGLEGYPKAENELQLLTKELWGNGNEKMRKIGDGNLFQNCSIEEALKMLKIAPDFQASKEMNWIHRTVEGKDVYFIANPADSSIHVNCSFRVINKVPEIWNPETGKVSTYLSYNQQDKLGIINLSLSLYANQSVFVVFTPTAQTKKNVVSVVCDNKELLNYGMAEGDKNSFNSMSGDVMPNATYSITLSNGKKDIFTATKSIPSIHLDENWDVHFQEGLGAPVKTTFSKLISWSDVSDAGIKYFSGTATYTKTINIPKGYLSDKNRIILDLGRVEVMAKVKVNGKDLGILWKKPYRVDLSEVIKEGKNELEVEVVNLWPNRLIGDEQTTEDALRNKNGTLQSWPKWLLDGKTSSNGRYTFCSWKLYDKDAKLLPSGLIGPVEIKFVPNIYRKYPKDFK